MTFGNVIAYARKRANLSLRELAAKIVKEDGQPISAQYLNDLEHDRRNPPSDAIIQQLAAVLQIDPDVLYFRAGEMPMDVRDQPVADQTVRSAFAAFRKALKDDAK